MVKTRKADRKAAKRPSLGPISSDTSWKCSNLRKRVSYLPDPATRPLGYCLRPRPFRCSAPISIFLSFQGTLDNHQPRIQFNGRTTLPRIALILSSSLGSQNQQIGGVIACLTDQCDLCEWRKSAFRPGRERGCDQGV